MIPASPASRFNKKPPVLQAAFLWSFVGVPGAAAGVGHCSAPEAERAGYLSLLANLRQATLGHQQADDHSKDVSGDPDMLLQQQLALLPVQGR